MILYFVKYTNLMNMCFRIIISVITSDPQKIFLKQAMANKDRDTSHVGVHYVWLRNKSNLSDIRVHPFSF